MTVVEKEKTKQFILWLKPSTKERFNKLNVKASADLRYPKTMKNDQFVTWLLDAANAYTFGEIIE